jgi:tight adherence protein B
MITSRDYQILRKLGFGMMVSHDWTFHEAFVFFRTPSPPSDQIFEAISISKTLGGAELLTILRTVGTFLRQDLALRREIEVKHGWIKNSAHLSAAAPWLLLLLLSTQPATARAFSTSSGVLILSFGVAMTAIAYMWMNRLGRLPELPRVFGEK